MSRSSAEPKPAPVAASDLERKLEENAVDGGGLHFDIPQAVDSRHSSLSSSLRTSGGRFANSPNSRKKSYSKADKYVGASTSPHPGRDGLNRQKSMGNMGNLSAPRTTRTLSNVIEGDEGAEPVRLRRRLLARDDYSRQCSGRLNINRVNRDNRLRLLRSPAHSLLALPTLTTCFLFSCLYVICFLIFAPFYQMISDECGLEITSFIQAFYLSLETFVTIGYGVPDQYYNECVEGTVLLTVQSIVGRFVDALVMATIYSRFVRGTRRGATVIFTDKCFLRYKQGKLYMMSQVVDDAHNQLLEAHVRFYAIRHAPPPPGMPEARPTLFQPHAMRLVHPDDNLGGMLLICMPALIVHEVDQWSPLMPPATNLLEMRRLKRAKEGKAPAPTWLDANPRTAYNFPEILNRRVDAEQGAWDMFECKVCGETYNTLEQWQTHIKASIRDEEVENLDQQRGMEDSEGGSSSSSSDDEGEEEQGEQEGEQEGGGAEAEDEDEDEDDEEDAGGDEAKEEGGDAGADEAAAPKKGTRGKKLALEPHKAFYGGVPEESGMEAWAEPPTPDELMEFWRESRLEILVMVEGVEPITSSTIQARHSYSVDDMVWDMIPAPCVTEGDDGRCEIDFGKFHDCCPPCDDPCEDTPMWPVSSHL